MALHIPKSRLFWAVGLGHLTNDIFMSMGPVVLAFISVTVMPMSNTQIGLTISAAQMMGAISQPGFGLIADRTGGRFLGAGGVAWSVTFTLLALLGAQTGVFWLLFFPWMLRALGSGAFHPVGSMHAADSKEGRSASNVAYFFLMGQVGLAMGPVIAGVLLDTFNPSTHGLYLTPFAPVYEDFLLRPGTVAPLYFVGLIALPVVLNMLTRIPRTADYITANGKSTQKADFKGMLASIPRAGLLILIAMVGLRGLAQPGTVAFVPVLFQEKGWSPSEYGAITSMFWLASAIAGVIFGNIADRFDRRWVVALSLLASAPTFFLLPIVDGTAAFVMAIVAGGLSGGSHSIIVVLAQELIPGAKGFASGMILGLIFGVGALGTAMMGSLSDIIGLGTTFQAVSIAVVISAGLALMLPVKEAPQPIAMPEGASAD